jgi:YHS domain-containing protein
MIETSIAGSSMRNRLAGLVLVLLLASCSTMNVGNTPRHNNVLLRGYDPVAYFTMGTPTPGSPDITAQYHGVTIYFANEKHREAFQREPERYLPQYGGFCANGAVYAIYLGGEPDTFEIIDSRLFIFGGARSRAYFLMDRERNLKLADAYWQEEGKYMSSYRLQTWKRQILKHPHYKTNRELAAEYEARFGKKPGG